MSEIPSCHVTRQSPSLEIVATTKHLQYFAFRLLSDTSTASSPTKIFQFRKLAVSWKRSLKGQKLTAGEAAVFWRLGHTGIIGNEAARASPTPHSELSIARAMRKIKV